MRVGLLGTGAIADKHAQAYRTLGFELAACSNRTESKGRTFAERWNAEYVPDPGDLCRYPGLDYIDVCTFPDSHLRPVLTCAQIGRAVLLQKPMATNLTDAAAMVNAAKASGIVVGVVSQHRFDDSILFLKRALRQGRLGKLLQADAYVKWFRSAEYYSRPIKGSWKTEGGGALINQAIHQVDLLLHLLGPVKAVQGMWQLGAFHSIESEDIVNALLRFESGATGVIEASTAFWPGTPERIELHGTKGLAIVTGDQLTAWSVLDDEEAERLDPAPISAGVASGSSDPMAIGLTSFERQFTNFAEAVRGHHSASSGAEDGYRALEVVLGIYKSCKTGTAMQLT